MQSGGSPKQHSVLSKEGNYNNMRPKWQRKATGTPIDPPTQGSGEYRLMAQTARAHES